PLRVVFGKAPGGARDSLALRATLACVTRGGGVAWDLGVRNPGRGRRGAHPSRPGGGCATTPAVLAHEVLFLSHHQGTTWSPLERPLIRERYHGPKHCSPALAEHRHLDHVPDRRRPDDDLVGRLVLLPPAPSRTRLRLEILRMRRPVLLRAGHCHHRLAR